MKLTVMTSTTTTPALELVEEQNFTTTVWPGRRQSPGYFEEGSSVAMYLYVVAPLLFCCFAIFACAVNSIWKTRSKLQALTQIAKQREPTEYTEFTIDLTTKMDSCVELSSPQISSKEESVLL